VDWSPTYTTQAPTDLDQTRQDPARPADSRPRFHRDACGLPEVAPLDGPTDRRLVVPWHVQGVDLVGRDEDQFLVLVAVGGCGVAVVGREEGQDEDVAMREDTVDPGVVGLADSGVPGELLLDLAGEAGPGFLDGATVSTTAEHPFMVEGRGWLDAASLKVGDLLVTPWGTVPVEAIETEQRAGAEVEAVYNFHVETHSNYYYVHVGTTPVLVHNSGHDAAARDLSREERVAKIVGGKLVKGSERRVHLCRRAGEAKNPAAFGQKLQISKAAADRDGVDALYYLEEGTPSSAIDQANKRFGADYVRTFPKEE
jgi:hypothetical protein